MHTCSRCNLQLHPFLRVCPVCGTYLKDSKDKDGHTSYPRPDYNKIKQQQKQLRYALLRIPFLIGILLTLIVDLFTFYLGYTTGLYMTFSMLFLYILLFKTILIPQEIGSIFIFYYAYIVVLAFSFPTFLPFSVAIELVFPLLSSLLLGLFMLFHWIQRRSNLLLLQGFLFSISFLFLSIISFFFVSNWIYMTLMFVSAFTLTIYLIFFRIKLISTLSRFFHI